MQKLVRGYSMYPFLRPMDVCSMAPVSPGRLRIGDIVQYAGSDNAHDIVHRVIDMDFSENIAVIKGDNLPSQRTEHIKISDIKARIVSIKRCGREIKMNRTCSFFIALLSRLDITPHLARKRFLDPVVLAFIKTSGYLKIREKMYDDLIFMENGEGGSIDVFAVLNGKKCARIGVEYLEGKGAFLTADIDYKDRNTSLVSSVVQKAIDLIKKRYSPECNVYIADPVLEYLIRDKKARSVREQVIFGEDIDKCLVK